MQSVVSRPQPLTPTSSSSHGPRKSSSFMSLGREKLKTPPTPAEATKASYFEAYPRIPTRSKQRTGQSSTPRSPPVAFPSVDPPLETSSHQSIRHRALTGPSNPAWTRGVPDLRFSGSSTQHTETPPETPVDSFDGSSFRDFAVVVSAPVSGVEMMDALVDGMNGGEDERPSRQRFGIPNHHPLYEPPLPTPPPGVILGPPKQRRPKRYSQSSDSSSEDEPQPPVRPRRRRPKPSPPSRANSASTIVSPPETPVIDQPSPSLPRKPVIVPSISDIIRTHGPQTQLRSRPSLRASSVYSHSQGHSTVHEESEPEPLTMEEEADFLSRSSVDSIADEVQQTLRTQAALRPAPVIQPSSSFRRYSTFSDTMSIASPRSDGAAGTSLYAPSVMSNPQPSSPIDVNFLSFTKQPSASQAVAQYIRSARLTTLLKLTRSPHASQDTPLTVSLSDLGSPSGYPVVVFLGLGCVRHVMGLYDDMAQCLGLRLITIDRWGLGRTEARSKSSKGVMQWASVVEEVLDMLQIGECSVMAHSAGTPYALSFANKLPERIRGNIFLLAPWVGGSENSGYKWLKYVPNGILKTAQAAEWKIQAWMIGKPPTIAYEGIGYTAAPRPKPPPLPPVTTKSASQQESRPRPSMGSAFSEYDDLRDFDGRFESKSTLGAGNPVQVAKRKPSRKFLNILKPTSPVEESKPVQGGKKLKALRSMGSLRSKASARTSAKRSEPSSPQLPTPPKLDFGLGLDDINWLKGGGSETSLIPDNKGISNDRFYTTPLPRAGGRRSMSFTATSTRSSLRSPASPAMSSYNTSSTSILPSKPNTEYQSTLGNALIAASHAESAGGMHNDLLQILNHENHPWGFSYTHYPHRVSVWYGDKDEKIAENAVRWMERNMGQDKCTVNVVKGADHALMYKSSVVVEVLEQILAHWQPEY
ncbi:hypothetical protein MIND_00460400 [Mycena indigotica]|uniref:Alpha/beta-hydrolase n=1 Tax=Mycena indigotica TaxID=2126181 RepID=A0A8H6SYK3_9AGAR|nr:uncharacterized protein MIND_00460400 [Mycena indigotica]KAF7306687.1 hypothetical protein MIND_00460400 [Mycena indigotica]